MNKINMFRKNYFFLSNFYSCPVEIDGIRFLNAEAAFQAMKCEKKSERYDFRYIPALTAKRLGRNVKLRPNWDLLKVHYMKKIVLDKFSRNPELKEKLLATGNAELIEGNFWNDTFWGVDLKTGVGENHLGKILMEVRKELRNALSE